MAHQASRVCPCLLILSSSLTPSGPLWFLRPSRPPPTSDSLSLLVPLPGMLPALPQQHQQLLPDFLQVFLHMPPSPSVLAQPLYPKVMTQLPPGAANLSSLNCFTPWQSAATTWQTLDFTFPRCLLSHSLPQWNGSSMRLKLLSVYSLLDPSPRAFIICSMNVWTYISVTWWYFYLHPRETGSRW